MLELRQQIAEAVREIRKATPLKPKVGIVLGTGLGSFVTHIGNPVRIPYSAIPHFPVATVDTHAGDLVVGEAAGKTVVAMAGRFHAYEGYSLQQITFPIRVAKALGVKMLIVSNAAGALNPQFVQGDLMLMTDHINLMGDNPLIGPNDKTLGPRYPDMSEPYTRSLIALGESVALAQGIRVQKGVYAAVLGPNLETAAEYRYLRLIGADAVGMSTVSEVIVAVHAGLEVLGFSALTDECRPDALKPASFKRIIVAANAIEPKMTAIVFGCLKEIKV